MASQNYFFTGECEWARLHKPDTKFNADGVYSLDLYLDPPSLEKFERSGLMLKLKNKGGKKYINLRRVHKKMIKGTPSVLGPPRILDVEGDEYEKAPLIGNGSRVTCKVNVYDTPKGKGHSLDAVRIDELVVYENNADRPDEGEAF